MSDEFLPNNQPQVKNTRENQISKNNTNSVAFSLAAAGSVVCDLGGYINNQAIQVNSGNANISTIQVSLDGENFYTGPASALGITKITQGPCRYVKITATGACQGLVFGSLH